MVQDDSPVSFLHSQRRQTPHFSAPSVLVYRTACIRKPWMQHQTTAKTSSLATLLSCTQHLHGAPVGLMGRQNGKNCLPKTKGNGSCYEGSVYGHGSIPLSPPAAPADPLYYSLGRSSVSVAGHKEAIYWQGKLVNSRSPQPPHPSLFYQTTQK